MNDREWVKSIRKGDIIRSKNSGVLRVVRSVQHGIRTSIDLTIMHCSWTTRCYTVYTGAWEIGRLFERTPYRLKLNRKIDLQIEDEIHRAGSRNEIKLHCCDVEGIN